MIGASKILTVSYGTFSCTLEGFDEPFSTMKAIAEYFRDLAAGDRYFGAVPPVPDAEMLHRIAEHEIKRRVEAKISENGIVLRQSPVTEALPVAAPQPVQSDMPAMTEPVAEAAAEAHVPPTDEPLPETPSDAAPVEHSADTESVAAKLARIRAAVSASREGSAARAAQQAAFDDASDEEDGDLIFQPEAEAQSQSFSFDLDLPELGQSVAGAEAASGAEPEAAAAVPPADETEEPAINLETLVPAEDPVVPVADTAAVVAHDAEADAVEAEYDLSATDGTDAETIDDGWSARFDAMAAEASSAPEAANLQDAAAAGDADSLVARLGLSADRGPEAADEATAAIDGGTDRAGDEAAVMSAVESDDGWADEDEDETRAFDGAYPHDADRGADVSVAPDEMPVSPRDAEAEAAGDELAEDAALAAAFREAEDAGPDAYAMPPRDSGLTSQHGDERTAAAMTAADPWAELREAPAEAEAETPLVLTASDETRPVETIADAAPQEQAETPDISPVASGRPGFLSRARARVIKVRKSVAAPKDEEQAIAGAVLSAADEAELAAELADVPAADDSNQRDAHDGRAILENAAPDNDEGVSRLMDEAATKLEGAENRRRFSAISHLKAAVAATVADRKLKSKDQPAEPRADDDEFGLYRDDLSKAVRPRRPVGDASGASTRRPALNSRPAPLVLVSEQRVDNPDELRGAGAVVRPRRINTGAMVLADEDQDYDEDADLPISPEDAANFAEFAERLGASDLPELLEAAAAYTASVEGHAHFSRPQILKKVAYVTEDGDFSREDGLRSFGMLLRQGKIQKIRRGQFALTDSSRFKSEARRAAH